jgi:hypothetical protein
LSGVKPTSLGALGMVSRGAAAFRVKPLRHDVL